MRNDHYGVRNEARKHRKWGMKRDSTVWKFRTQKSDGNIYYDFENKFEAIDGVILYIPYIVSKLGKSRV